MNTTQMNEALGKTGEHIVKKVFIEEGHTVVMSDDPYDSIKDMTIDGQTVEVKTQMRYVIRNAFTIEKKQLKKCMNVDILLFVNVPIDNIIEIYQYMKKETLFEERVDRRQMICFPIEDLSCVYKGKRKDMAEELRKYCTSILIKKKAA